jgi:hypothetical protein
MGFHLWIVDDIAWAEGTYEYRPMGAAVIAASDLFRRRDFHARSRAPRLPGTYNGQFASLGHINAHLMARRRAPVSVRE